MRFAVTVNIRANNGQLVWYPFEHEAESVEGFHAALREQGLVSGTRFETTRGPGNTLIVRRSIPAILSKDAIFSVTALNKQLVDEEGRAV